MIKKIKLAFIFVIFLFIIACPKNINATWSTNSEPVFTFDSANWDSDHLAAPMVIKDDDNYKLWYQGINNDHWSIGYATSIDNITWQRNLEPVLFGQNEGSIIETDVVEPSVLKEDSYLMWYHSLNSNTGQSKIRMATSDDGINWIKSPNPVLEGTNPWEEAGISDPSVIYHDGKYRMFYGGIGNPSFWQIGYAESTDGINWEKPFSNPLSLPHLGHFNGPSAAFYDGKYHLFYHTGGGAPTHIYHVSSSDLIDWQCEDGCLVVEADGLGFDSQMITGPSVLKDGNNLLLYYTGFNGTVWQIGLATKQLQGQEPEPEPEPQEKIVVIPGLMASWNKEAMFYNFPTDYSQWQLNPIVTDYNALFNSLENIGKQENQDYYVFYYDWRKSLEEQVNDFDAFLTNNNLKEEPLKVIGHSLGGLVARLYAQKYELNNLEQIVTVGTPHQGVVQVYKALAGGEFTENNPYLWLAEKIAVQLYRSGLETDREIIANNFPVLNDLLPTYPYLYNRKDSQIKYGNYLYQNTLLAQYNNLDSLNSILTSVMGEKENTPYAYQLGSRNYLDKLFNNYPEGRPKETKLNLGDLVVPSFSAQTENHEVLNFDHGELIYKKQAIKKIFDQLGFDYQDEQIQEGSGTQVFPSMLFLVLSPVSLEVEINGQNYQEENGMILIPEAEEGNYNLRAQGNENGEYTIIVGNIKEDNDEWFEIKGKIEAETPQSQIDEFQVNLQNQSLEPESSLLFEQIYQRVAEFSSSLDNEKINLILTNLDKFRNKPNRNFLKRVHNNLFKLVIHSPLEYRDSLIKIIEMLEEYYSRQNFSYQTKLQMKLLRLEKRSINQNYWLRRKILLAKTKLNKDVKQQSMMLTLAFEKLSLGKAALAQKKLALIAKLSSLQNY